MALHIEDPVAERLASELATIAGESETEAVRKALEERRARLGERALTTRQRGERLRRWLESEIWPNLPPETGARPLSKAEREEILGYGPDGLPRR